MKRIYCTLLFVSSILSQVFGQQTTFSHDYSFGFGISITGNAIESITPGNYVFAGVNANFIPIRSAITEVDATGTTIWSRTYGLSLAYQLVDIKKDATNYYVCGGSNTGAGVFMIVDAAGTPVVTRNITISQADAVFFQSVKKTSDGGYILAGYVNGYDPDGAGPEDKFNPITYVDSDGNTQTAYIASPLIMKLDASGNHQWHHVTRYYITSNTPANRIYNSASFNDVQEVADGFIAVGGYKVNQWGTVTNSDNNDATARNAMIFKTDLAGSFTYHRQIGNPDINASQTTIYYNSINPTSSGQPVLSGYIGSGQRVIAQRLPSSGGWTGTTYSRRLGTATTTTVIIGGFPITSTSDDEIEARIFELNDGSYGIMGYRIVPLSFDFAQAILKFNPSNNTFAFARRYQSSFFASFFPRGGQVSDNGFISLGMSGSAISGWTFNLTKFDANGDLGSALCNTTAINPVSSSYGPTFGTPIFNNWNTNTVNSNSVTPVVTSPLPTQEFICLATVCTPPPLATTVTATPNPICAGQSTSITASGPGTNVSYNVFTAPTGGANLGASPVSVSPGTTTTYYIETVDNSDPTCVSTSRVPVTVTVNPSPVANPQSNSPICVGQTLNLTTDAVTGGTYSWSGPNAFNSTDQNPSIPNAQLVNGGTYELIVTAAGCSTGPIPITVIVAETPTSSPSAVSAAVCAGSSIELIGNTVPGGSYAWTGPNGFNSTDQNPTIPNASAANAGTYNLIISIGSCSSTSNTVAITVNPAPTATASNDGPICQGNTITLSATGGTSYAWTGPNGAAGNGSPLTITSATPGDGGLYEVTVTDGSGCTATAQTTVTITNGASLSISETNVLCNGESNGTATVVATGNGPFSYSWSPTGGTGATATGLSSGPYTVTVTDNNGCTSSENSVIGEPDALGLTSSSTNSQCTVDDGSATVNATGGTGAYTYSWSSGGNAATETNLGPNIYTVTVSDANGCQAQINVTVGSVNGPNLNLVNSTNVSCFGANDGSAEVLASAGTPGYSYSWSPSGGTNASATGLGPNTYTATVTDDAGCQALIQVTISEPAAITATVTATNANCGINDGAISLVASGGTPSYSFTWTPNVGNTASISNLAAGSYSVEIEDASGCTIVVNQTISTTGTIPIDVIPAISTIEAGDNVQLEVILPAGVTGATYTWTPTTGLSCSNCPNPVAAPNQTTTYYVTVTTPDGCVATDSAIVIVNQPCGELFVPTIFSPNGDSQNDELCVYGSCFETFHLTIFSRWGEKVFETTDPAECWNGTFRDKPMNTGVFVYKLILRQTGDTEERLESGNINLVR